MPYRAFGPSSDLAAGTYFRSDSVSLLFVPSTASQTTLAAPMMAGGLEITINEPATCPAATANQLCGVAGGDQVLIFDPTGAWDVFTVDRAGVGGVFTLEGPPSERGFAAGANVAKARAVTYSLKADPATGAFQLVRSDGIGPAQPVLDQVVRLQFQYFGEPEPPRVIDATDSALRASYGPAPPPVDQQLPAWPPGENCTFFVSDGRHQPRLTTLGVSGAVVELPPAVLTDGPWCPDSAARNRFDADLLRIRRVRFTLRVQTAVRSLRGPAGPLFVNQGFARSATRYVPDMEIQIDVTPRNVNLEL
jgi:hypothetical protein